MNGLQKKIHDLLLQKYTQVSDYSVIKNKYSVPELEMNLFEPMADETKAAFIGSKDHKISSGKMNSLRSSSAMTFNLFGNGPVMLDSGSGSKEFKVTYEMHLDTLKDSNVPSNIDVVLESDDEIIFFVMKLFEPFYHKTSFFRELSRSYENEERYFYPDSVYSFKETVEKLRTSGIKRYDACQMFKHSLGIYNYLRKNEISGKKVRLINCIWSINEPVPEKELQAQYELVRNEEERGFQSFYDCMFNILNAFKKKGYDFSIELMKVKDLVPMIGCSEEKRNWLARYL